MSYLLGKFVHLRLQGCSIDLPVYNKGDSKPPPPVDPNIGLAQQKMADLSTKQYNQWHDEEYPALQKAQASQEARSNDYYTIAKHQSDQQSQWGQEQHDVGMKLQNQQLGIADTNQKNADDYTARMKNTFYPIQDKIVQDAKDYNTNGNVERQSGLAMGDVNSAFQNQRDQQRMQRQSYGINPNSGAAMAQDQQAGIQQAATAAAAGTRARDAAVQLGWAKNMDAASLGMGLPGNQATSTGLGLNAGSTGIASGMAGMQQQSQSLGSRGAGLNAGQTNFGNIQGLGNSISQGYGGAQSGWNAVGSLGAQSYGIQSQNWRQQQQNDAANSSGIGGFLGSALGAATNGGTGGFAASGLGMLMSDIRTKQNIEHVGTLPSGVRVYEFEYKPQFKIENGLGRFRGVMAHEVEKVIPEAVAIGKDGYKRVNYSLVR